MRFPFSTNCGFSLTELLIVVGIIALLAAILLPVFGRARENGRRSVCQSHLKQIGLGALQYMQDYDEVIFSSFYGTPGDSSATNYKWMDAIFPYVRSEQVFTCPSDNASNKRYLFHARPEANTGPLGGKNYGSYGLNGAYGAGTADNYQPPRSGNGVFVSLSQFSDPSGTIWIVDNNNEITSANPGGSQGFFWSTPANNPAITASMPRQLQNIIERHLETTNALFTDGHAKALKLSVLARTKTLGADPVMTIFTIQDD